MIDRNKQLLRDFIETVWNHGDLSALPRFWSADCVNHAASSPEAQKGLDALRAYHEGFAPFFVAFSDMRTEIVQQIAEDDRVVTYMKTTGTHTGELLGYAPTHKTVSLMAMRLDRIVHNKIAEHWSVSDMAGLIAQIQN